MAQELLSWVGAISLAGLAIAALMGAWTAATDKWYWYRKARYDLYKDIALRELGTTMIQTSYWYGAAGDRLFVELIGHRLQSGEGYDVKVIRDARESSMKVPERTQNIGM